MTDPKGFVGKRLAEIEGKVLGTPTGKPGTAEHKDIKVQLPHTMPNYTAGYQLMPENFDEIPNYDRLTRGERWVMDRLPGIADTKVMQALQKFNETPIGRALQYLDIGAEALERGTGLFSQWANAMRSDDPDHLPEFMENLTSAWFAGSLASDVANLPQWGLEGEVGVPEDLPGIDSIVIARKRISELTRQGMDNREALAIARDEIYSSAGALQLRMQLQDMAFHVLADPLNILAAYVKPVSLAKTKILNVVANKALSQNVIDDAVRVVDDAMRVTKKAGELDELRRAKIVLEATEVIGPWEERVLKFMGELPIENEGAVARFLGSKWNPFGLTPESRAHGLGVRVMDDIATNILSDPRLDPIGKVQAIEKIAAGTVAPELAHMLVNVEGRHLRTITNGVATKARQYGVVWTETTPQRNLVNIIAGALGEEPYSLYRMIEGDEVAEIVQRFTSGLTPEAADNLALQLGEMGFGSLDDALGDAVKVMGADPLLTPEAFNTALLVATVDRAAEYSVLQFGLKSKGAAMRMANLVKSAENLAFLRLSPGYMMRNAINNEFTMLSRGTWTWSAKAGLEFWDNVMKMRPARLQAGVGAAGRVAGQTTTEAMEAFEKAIAEVTMGDAGWLDKGARAINGINLGPVDMAKRAAGMEATASVKAFTGGTMRFWQKYWPKIYKKEVSMRNVPDLWNSVVADVGEDAARALDNALSEVRHGDDLDNILFKAADLPAQKGQITDDVSRALGKDVTDIIEAEELGPMLDEMIDVFGKEGPDAMRAVANRQRETIRKNILDAMDNEMAAVTQQSANRVQTEGVGAIEREFSEAMDDFWGEGHEMYAIENGRAMDKFKDLKEVSPAVANAYINRVREESQRYWALQFKKIKARMRGVKAGIQALEKDAGQTFPHTDDIFTRVDEWERTWKDVFTLKNRLQKDYWERQLAGKSKKMGFEFIAKQVDEAYAKAAPVEDRLIREIEEIIALYVPENQRVQYRTWRALVHEARNTDRQMVMDFWKDPLRDGRTFYQLSEAEKTSAYAAHQDIRLESWRKIVDREKMGQSAMAGNRDAQAELARNQGLADAHRQYMAEQLPLPLGEAAEEVAEEVAEFSVAGIPDYYAFADRIPPVGTGRNQLWTKYGDDAMALLEEGVITASKNRAPKIASLSPDVQKALIGQADMMKSAIAKGRSQSVKFGEWMRDSALLNYNRRMNYDNWLGMIMPYEFWFTHSMQKWALHSIDRPFAAGAYYKTLKMLRTGYRPEAGLPARMKDHIRVKVPFLPEWLGDEILIDPMNSILPLKQWEYPFEIMAREKHTQHGATRKVLDELLADGQISQEEYDGSMRAGSGPVWDRAAALAQRDYDEGRMDWFDFGSALTAPHAPLAWAYNVARGTPERIGPALPLTRSIKGITALLGISPNTGGVNIEGAVRKEIGLPAFDQWGPYRDDRMLSDMVADGIPLDIAMRAMIERESSQDPNVVATYQEARRRAGIEYGITAMGSLIGMPMKAYPEGEEHLRGLRDNYEAAWADYEMGNPEAIQDFYEENPGYEARLALWKSPEEKMHQFLEDQIWDKYHNMPTAHRQQVKEEFGELFTDAFLNKDTRDTSSIDANTMAVWLKIMGGETPGMVNYDSENTPINFIDSEKAHRLEAFYQTRENNFHYYQRVKPLWDDYFKLEDAAQRQYWRENPLLGEYVQFRDRFMYNNPDLAPFLEDDPERLPRYDSEQELQRITEAQPGFTQMEWQNVLGVEAYRLIQDSEPLPDAVKEVLSNLGISREQVLQNQ